MNYSIFDIESDGLIETATKIHCMSVNQVRDGVSTKFSLTSYEEMRNFLATEDTLVGHNIIRFDVPMLEKFLSVTVTSRLIDTLGLSWYLYPNRLKHGLEVWGDELGVEKPKITDWSNQSIEDYLFRCESDVEINTRLFTIQMNYLMLIYGNADSANRLINYLTFKLTCAREQEEVKWKLDVDKCKSNLEMLQKIFAERVDTLKSMIPTVGLFKDITRPKVLYKKDGSPSVAGQNWLNLLQEKGLPPYHVGTIRIKTGEKPGNPGSHAQLKSWLYTLGWIPETFKYDKEEDGSLRKIPQLSTDDGQICESIKKLYPIIPELEALEGMFVVKHRIGILEGFLENRDENDMLKAEIKGFTNTLRFQHTTIVNLPQIPKPYWQEIRGCLIAPTSEHILCGSDMSGLEDNTKRHYMFYYDPDYVNEMMSPDFDPHLDIAVLAGMMTAEQAEAHKLYDKTKGKEGLSYKPVRLKAKKVNFSGVYGAGPPKMALTGGFTLPEAKVLHTTYWKRNWSVKQIAKDTIHKAIGGQMWLFNPVSQFWYSLRVEKDKFSTLNQGTGVYCFDTWVRYVRKSGFKCCGQFHDEVVIPLLKTEKEHLSNCLDMAIDAANFELNLNVTLRISKDFGNNYAEIH